MKILVCIKQVPDRESKFKPAPTAPGYEDTGLVYRINYYDEFALEEAFRIKEKIDDVEITAFSVGSERAESTVRRGMEMGADLGVHILDPEAPARDALEIASTIATYARSKHFDLIFTGVMAEDDQQCSVGPMVAELLQIPSASTVISQKLSDDLASTVVHRELEGGIHEIIELPLPALLTIQSGINLPRYPSLTNKLRAKKQEIEQIPLSTIGHPVRCGNFLTADEPPSQPQGELLQGSLEEIADQLIDRIQQKTPLL